MILSDRSLAPRRIQCEWWFNLYVPICTSFSLYDHCCPLVVHQDTESTSHTWGQSVFVGSTGGIVFLQRLISSECLAHWISLVNFEGLCVRKTVKQYETHASYQCLSLHFLTEWGPAHIRHINPSLLLDGCILLFWQWHPWGKKAKKTLVQIYLRKTWIVKYFNKHLLCDMQSLYLL